MKQRTIRSQGCTDKCPNLFGVVAVADVPRRQFNKISITKTCNNKRYGLTNRRFAAHHDYDRSETAKGKKREFHANATPSRSELEPRGDLRRLRVRTNFILRLVYNHLHLYGRCAVVPFATPVVM